MVTSEDTGELFATMTNMVSTIYSGFGGFNGKPSENPRAESSSLTFPVVAEVPSPFSIGKYIC